MACICSSIRAVHASGISNIVSTEKNPESVLVHTRWIWMFSSRKCSLNRFVIWIRSFTVLKLPPAFFVRAFISLLNLLMTTLYNQKNSLRHVLFGCARTIPSRRSGSLLRFREFQAVRGTDCLTKQGCLRGVVPPRYRSFSPLL